MAEPSGTIVVLGPYRSGTSLVSGVLAALGVDFGMASPRMLQADRSNPLGYFQRPDVVDANTRLIETAGGTLEAPLEPAVTARQGDPRALAAVDLSWRRAGRIAGLKDPRFCATLPAWLAAGLLGAPPVRVVRVARDPGAIARSVARHRTVGAFVGMSQDRALAMARAYDALAAACGGTDGVEVHVVRYDDMIADPVGTTAGLGRFIGVADAGRVRAAARLVGKRRAIARHYLGKLQSPALLLETVAKSVQAVFKRS